MRTTKRSQVEATAKPYKLIDKRGGSSFFYSSGDRLFEASRQSSYRKQIPRVDKDTAQNLSTMGRRNLMSAARLLFSRFGPIRGAVMQMANYAIGQSFNIQFRGADKAWGEKMEAAIYEHDKICDVRGENFDFRSGLIQDLVSIIRDGDTNFILTETGSGWPLYQTIPAHRVGGYYAGDTVNGGPYDGYAILNGVILDEYQRPVAYRVCAQQSYSDEGAVDVPARDFGQYYRPDYQDQVGGITWLASAIIDAQDIADTRGYTKTGLKAEALITLIEENESGSPLDGNPISGGPTSDDTTAPHIETLDETIRYFRAGTNSKISAPNSQRPSQNAQDFSFEILRGAFESLGWPIELYDPTKLGGANIRLRVAQACRAIEQLQTLADKIARRKHLYAVAKLMAIGVLPFNVDWWKFEHQRPRNLTVDNGRDMKADLEKFNAGADSLAGITGRDGEDWQEVIDQRIREEKYIKEQSELAGVDPGRIRFLNNAPQPNDPANQPVDE